MTPESFSSADAQVLLLTVATDIDDTISSAECMSIVELIAATTGCPTDSPTVTVVLAAGGVIRAFFEAYAAHSGTTVADLMRPHLERAAAEARDQ